MDRATCFPVLPRRSPKPFERLRGAGFHFQSEGWFDKDSSLGLDKFGRAYSTYLISEFLGGAIRRKAADGRGAELTAAALAMGVMTYVEVFDGFAEDHGFSYEDLVANAADAGFSVLRNSVPGLKQKLDFRLLYLPSGNVKGFHPITDYSGQRNGFALKLAGFDAVARTPLRFVELQGGYYAWLHRRGGCQGRSQAPHAVRRRRPKRRGSAVRTADVAAIQAARWGRTALEYVQVPYTAVYSRRYGCGASKPSGPAPRPPWVMDRVRHSRYLSAPIRSEPNFE